jgi:adsorption protein B
MAIDRSVIQQVPAELALHYAVLPLREEGSTLVLASEDYLDPVSTAALARKLKRPVSYVIVPKGQVTVGLRHWHARRQNEDPRRTLADAVATQSLTAARAEALWQEYVPRQVLFAEILMSLGHLDRAMVGAVLLRHERSLLSLGEYMVGDGIISTGVLNEALELQQTLQCSIASLLEREGLLAAAGEKVLEAYAI